MSQSEKRAETERKLMAEVPDEKSWTVPGAGPHGPLTMTLRLPEVTVTDAAGHSIVIAPNQAELIGGRLIDAADWARDLVNE